MSDHKQVQLAGGPADQQNLYTGVERELTVDESNWSLRLHDGAEPGGRPILNRDDNDARYQKRSVELDGLLGFEPSHRGILVRLGPSDYRLRSLTVDGRNMVIDNSNGYDGDPIFGLAPTIESDHTWTGANEFTEEIEATGGVRGNVQGNVEGNLDGNVTGNVVGDLTGDATGNHQGTFTGSVDVSAGSITFAAGQIPLAALGADVLARMMLIGVPIGSIIPFNGDVVGIPDNYRLCDGTAGTPDLRDRFIMGAGPINPAGAFGGLASHTHTLALEAGGAHSHTGSVGGTSLTVSQIPAHDHGNGVVDAGNKLYNHGNIAANPTMGDSIDGNSATGTREGLTSMTGAGDPHSHGVSIDSGGEHTHTGEVSEGTNLPPYYAKLYIMRIS